jgi:PAS domain S-box-containing protein
VHRLLKRQVEEFLKVSNCSELPDDIVKFIEAVGKSYEDYEIDHKLLQNTIITSTDELSELNLKIRMESELRLKGLMEQAPYGFLIVDYSGKIFDTNRFASDILGYEKSDLLTTPIFTLFYSMRSYSFNGIKEAVERGENLSFDDTFTTSLYSEIPVEITAGKIVIEEKPHVLIMFQDIIERVQADKVAKQKQLEIEALNRELEERVQQEVMKNMEKDQLLIQQSKMAAMGDMMGNIAHQWRQPLNNLSIAIQDVEEAFLFDELDEEYIKEFVTSSMSNVRFMSKTIDDFRNFFKPAKTKEVFQLRDAIEDILNIVTAQLKNNSITISLHGKNHDVIGYPNEFKQVILNLTNNAKDAIIDNEIVGGEITISIEDGSAEYKVVVVQDNGGGVPPHIINKIFEPYFTTKEGSKGTGIGLYMSKTIVEGNMGGKLHVENRDGGARFSLHIPSAYGTE